MKSQDTNKKSSEQLHREVHGQIDKLGSDIDTARSRLSPGALLDDAVFHTHGQSLTDTYTHLKNNPMGTMFLSLGTLLLMEDKRTRMTYEERLRHKASATVDRTRVQFGDVKERISESAHAAQESLSSRARDIKDRATHKLDQVKAKASHKASDAQGASISGKERVQERARDLKERGSEKLRHATEAAREKSTMARRQFEDMGELHPLAIASVGLGLGASLGASFPIQEGERRNRSEAFEKRMRQFGEDANRAVRESGERLKNRLIDELKQVHFH